VFLGLCVLWLLGCEAAARLLVPRISKIEGEVQADMRAALALRRNAGGPKQLLVLGNSLLETGLDREKFAAELAPQVTPTVVVVQQTSFYDWYYGIRKLLADGSDPDAVLLMLSPHQLIHDGIRGDYTSSLMMRPTDVPDAARRMDLHLTVESGLFLSTLSRFLGLRVEIRKVALGKVMPEVPVLLQKLAPTGALAIDPVQLEAKGRERLTLWKETLADRKIQPIFVVFPPLTPEEVEIFKRLEHETGVPILMPLATPDSLEKADFMPDGFHLGPSGARKLTKALEGQVRELLRPK
jgi:hypothetical protein